MSAEKFITIQHQMRQNQAELTDYLQDLDQWSSEVKIKDEQLKKEDQTENKNLPPVRNSLEKSRKKKKKKPKTDGSTSNPERIAAYDFRSWDKYDVDKACKAVDKEDGESSSEYETDEEWEELRMKQQAVVMKDQGNQYFKEKKYDEAVECYTRGISCDPRNALLPANRAMALLKLEKYGAAELDCSAAIAQDSTYIKAYQRRGTARLALKKLKEAKDDFQQVIRMEPGNKLAKAELDKLEKLMNPPKFSTSVDGEAGIVKPVHKPLELRSKKPLHRLVIEEVGDDGEDLMKVSAKKVQDTQGETKHKLVAKDNKDFNKFIHREETESHQRSSVATKLVEAMSPADICLPVDKEDHDGSKWGNDTESITKNVNPPASAVDTDRLKDIGETYTNRDIKTRNKETPVINNNIDNSPKTSPRLPAAPTTSYQFQTDWKVLKNNNEKFYQYLKQIEPTSLPKLFGQALDAEILMQIFRTLKDFYVPNSFPILPVLQCLPLVKRFNMTVMFLSFKDHQVVEILFDHLETASVCGDKELMDLKKLYNL